ncbi:MAG: hypothetical protein HZB42_03835 [Sphingobacteriales bacterium]|nr:hypothetical protein [Sphingobacteriales bacterium]
MKKSIGIALSMLAVCFAFSSFSHKPGGEGFEVFLNNKLILQRFGNQLNTAQTIQLNQGSANDELSIKYYHCGTVGKNRMLTIKDGQNKVLKEYHFADASSNSTGMKCRVNEIISLRKGNNSVLKLYYSSSEIPAGRLLASIVSGSSSTASLMP